MKYEITNQHYIGSKIKFIKQLRSSFVGLSLKDAKEFSDQFNFDPSGVCTTNIFDTSLYYGITETDYKNLRYISSIENPHKQIADLAKNLINQECYYLAQKLLDIIVEDKR